MDRGITSGITRSRVLFAAFAVVVPMNCIAAEPGNWYLKAGLDFERFGKSVFVDGDCLSESPAALYGCGIGRDGFPHRSIGSFETAETIQLGVGRAVSSRYRLELLFNYRPPRRFQGRANFLDPEQTQSVRVDLSALSGVFGIQVDLPEWNTSVLGRVVPFLGGGVGVSRMETSETIMTFPRTQTTVLGDKWTSISWTLAAGISAPLSSNLTIELAWRYIDLDQVRTGRGIGKVEWHDGSRDPLLLDIAPTQSQLDGNRVGLTVRYTL